MEVKMIEATEMFFGGEQRTFRMGDSLFWAADNFPFYSTDNMLDNIGKATKKNKGVVCSCSGKDFIFTDYSEFICIKCKTSWLLNDNAEFELTGNDNSMWDKKSLESWFNFKEGKKLFSRSRESDWYKNK